MPNRRVPGPAFTVLMSTAAGIQDLDAIPPLPFRHRRMFEVGGNLLRLDAESIQRRAHIRVESDRLVSFHKGVATADLPALDRLHVERRLDAVDRLRRALQ